MRRNIVVMNLLVVFYWMSMYAYVPNLPEYATALGADAIVLGVIGGVYGIAQVILRIPIGVISDRAGKNKRMLAIGSLVLALSCGILILAGNTGLIIAGRLIAGAAAAWWVIQSAAYADYFDDEKQVKAQGMLTASSNWGKLAASFIGGIMAQFFGVHSIFVFSFIIAIPCILLPLWMKEKPDAPNTAAVSEKSAASLRDVLPLLRNRDLIVFSVIGILTNILGFAAPILFTSVAAENLGASSFDLGMLNTIFYLLAGGTSLFVGTKLYKKIGGIHALAIAFFLTGISCIPAFYHLNLAMIYVMQILIGVGFGIICAAVAGFVILCVPPGQRGAATGIYQSLYGIGILVGPVLVGDITKAVSFDAAYWTLVGVAVFSALFCYIFIPKRYARL
jgi:MFS family permease